MNFVDLKRESLSVVYNSITYTKDLYKTATVTGVTDETYPNWAVDTIYAVGDFVIVPELKSIYRSTSANSGKFPLAYTDDWIFWGFINSARMFSSDENIGAKTTGTDMTVVVDFSQSNTIALLDIDFVSTVHIQQINNSDSSIVTDLPISSRDIACSSFAQYCYDPIRKNRKIIITDLVWLPSSTLTITFTGDVSIGTLGFGILEEMGICLLGTSMRWESKSVVKNNEFTSYREVIRYGKIRVLEAKVIFNINDFNRYSQRIDELLDRNILFVPTLQDKFSELIQIGYMENFAMPLENEETIETTTSIIGVPR